MAHIWILPTPTDTFVVSIVMFPSLLVHKTSDGCVIIWLSIDGIGIYSLLQFYHDVFHADVL